MRCFIRPFYSFALLGLALGLVSLADPAHAATGTPTQEEQAVLDRYPVFSANIEIIAANADGAIHAFLEQNDGKTVFLDTAVLRYVGASTDISDDLRDKIPPSDRFENSVIRKCWSGDVEDDFTLVSGDGGFPLPKDEADIQAGCGARIAFRMDDGDMSPSMQRFSGMDKFEIFVNGFFTVAKSTTANGKTLYTLSEAPVEDATLALFRTYKTVQERPIRPLGMEPPSGEEPAPAKPVTGRAE